MFLSYLPLAHIFDRVAEETFMSLGGSIGYWQGSPKTLLDDVGALRPTIFVGVPRIFDRIYTGVTQKVPLSLPPLPACSHACERSAIPAAAERRMRAAPHGSLLQPCMRATPHGSLPQLCMPTSEGAAGAILDTIQNDEGASSPSTRCCRPDVALASR